MDALAVMLSFADDFAIDELRPLRSVSNKMPMPGWLMEIAIYTQNTQEIRTIALRLANSA